MSPVREIWALVGVAVCFAGSCAIAFQSIGHLVYGDANGTAAVVTGVGQILWGGFVLRSYLGRVSATPVGLRLRFVASICIGLAMPPLLACQGTSSLARPLVLSATILLLLWQSHRFHKMALSWVVKSSEKVGGESP